MAIVLQPLESVAKLFDILGIENVVISMNDTDRVEARLKGYGWVRRVESRFAGRTVNFTMESGSIRVTGDSMTIKQGLYHIDHFLLYALKQHGIENRIVSEILIRNAKLPIGTSLKEIAHKLRGSITGKKFNF